MKILVSDNAKTIAIETLLPIQRGQDEYYQWGSGQNSNQENNNPTNRWRKQRSEEENDLPICSKQQIKYELAKKAFSSNEWKRVEWIAMSESERK